MRKALGFVLPVILVACSSSNGTGSFAPSTGNSSPPVSGGGSGGGTAVGPGTPSATPGSSTSGGGGTPSTGLPGAADAGPPAGAAGVLTAGIWDDALNYDFFSAYLAAHPQVPGDPGFLTSDYAAARSTSEQRSPHALVDVAVVMDTTGSMGDEIAYLTAEFAGISGAIATAFPGAAQRWALVVYRDTPDTDPGDDYVVKSFDFTSDMSAFATTVGGQTAANGGDYPESPELGLAALEKLTWRAGSSVAKLAFWVADAPHHAERGAAMKQAIVQAQGAGIHLYPVSASGTDELLELTMRSAAEISGGRYLFLTDDSGVGDPHKVPEIPCYFVTRLERAIVRVVGMELSGTYAGPNPADVLRASGSPSANGTCAVDDGGTVQIY
jgi:hypothetical protein